MLLQKTIPADWPWGQFPAPMLQPTTTCNSRSRGELIPTSGLCGWQAQTWCEHIHADIMLIYIKINHVFKFENVQTLRREPGRSTQRNKGNTAKPPPPMQDAFNKCLTNLLSSSLRIRTSQGCKAVSPFPHGARGTWAKDTRQGKRKAGHGLEGKRRSCRSWPVINHLCRKPKWIQQVIRMSERGG